MFQHFFEQTSIAQAIAPLADIITSNLDSRLFHMQNFSKGVFIIELGVGATGTTTVQLMGSDDNAKTNAAGLAYSYKTMNSDGSSPSVVQQATSAGVLTPAGGGKIMEITFQPDQLPATQPWVFLRTTTGTSSAVTGSVLFLAMGGRYQQAIPINPAT